VLTLITLLHICSQVHHDIPTQLDFPALHGSPVVLNVPNPCQCSYQEAEAGSSLASPKNQRWALFHLKCLWLLVKCFREPVVVCWYMCHEVLGELVEHGWAEIIWVGVEWLH
jgi:hypothetical protein